MDDLRAKHKKEQQDLASKITQKKKNATKKTRKGVEDECARLERDLKERQQQEVAELSGDAAVEENDAVEEEEEGEEEPERKDDTPQINEPKRPAPDTKADTNGLEKPLRRLSVSFAKPNAHHPGDEPPEPQQSSGRKRNRAKERLARRAAEQQEMVKQAKEEAANMPDEKELERKRMAEQLEKHGLVMKEIRADGHCLYAAVADQMGQLELSLRPNIYLTTIGSDEGEKKIPEYKIVRHAAAAHIEEHKDDYTPFLEEDLDQYLRKIRDTGEWGGHLELMALAKAYSTDINVLHADGRIDKIESGSKEKEGKKVLWLGYYRHGFGLGEHYNSLRKKP